MPLSAPAPGPRQPTSAPVPASRPLPLVPRTVSSSHRSLTAGLPPSRPPQVHIYRLVSENTIEENILKKSDQKRQLDYLAIQSGGFTTDMLAQVWRSLCMRVRVGACACACTCACACARG
jgi:hypothetical protein